MAVATGAHPRPRGPQGPAVSVVGSSPHFPPGKSELISAIFFADFGQRLLPSSAGRTTMCPTELLYDSTRPPSIRLLPIPARGAAGAVVVFKNYAGEWGG